VVVGELLVGLYPERADGWLHRAYALRRATNGGLTRARESLLPAADQFPDEPVIPYNVACYAAQLGELDEARTWLRRAFAVGRFETIQTMALSDADLTPLWDEVRLWKR
jgi:Flp pilus assembly protein TadD